MAEIDLSSMQPHDAAVALRSFPRRYRDAARMATADLDGEPDEAEVDEMATRPGPDGWSGADVVEAAARRLDAAREAVARALVTDAVAVPAELARSTGVVEAGAGASLAGSLERLSDAAERYAAVVDDAAPEAWNRRVDVEGDGSITVVDLLRRSIEPVVGWLRDVERVLRAVRGRPRT